MSLKESLEYKRFRSWVPLKKVSVDPRTNKIWRFFDWGKSDAPPLVLLHGASGTAEAHYQQLMSLCPKGYRLLSVQFPAYSTHERWIRAFDRFLDEIKVASCHLFGSALGGYLALSYAQLRPVRVLSVILCNSFATTKPFEESPPMAGFFSWAPKFLLARTLLENFPSGEVESRIADSVDFMVTELETLTQEDLASRMKLNCSAGLFDPEKLALDPSFITIIDVRRFAYYSQHHINAVESSPDGQTTDDVALSDDIRNQLYDTFPTANRAFLRDGGNFPYLSRSDEVNLYIEVHLRRVTNLLQEPTDASPNSDNLGDGSPAADAPTPSSSSPSPPDDART